MTIEGLSELLGEFHPFHTAAREEIADLVASRVVVRPEESVSEKGGPRSSSPFLAYVSAPEEAVDNSPVQHILLHGPAGCGKRNLATALQKCLKGRVEVQLQESDNSCQVDRGIVVWIARDGAVPKNMPARTPRVRIRSLSSSEKRRLVGLLVETVCPCYGLQPGEFRQEEILQVLLRGGYAEAGVLGATQRLHKLCRRRARLRLEGNEFQPDLTWATGVLGPEARPLDLLPTKLPAGCVHAPVVSSLGGAMSQIEALAYPGKGRLVVTGAGPQAELAARVARSRCLAMAQQLRFPVDTLRDMDWHLNVMGPDGPKDGVSLGLPALVAMASHLSGVPVDARFAFTGEIGLAGEIRPVGMVEEKFLACEREGFRKFWLPTGNVSELSGLDPSAMGSCEAVSAGADLVILRQLGLASSRT
ncbi:MAG: hypothetical protein RL173_211 [Fibrobacterota bacterium]